MIEPETSAGGSRRRLADFDQQQFMVGAARRQCRRFSPECPPDLLKSQQITVERRRPLQVPHEKHDMSQVVRFHLDTKGDVRPQCSEKTNSVKGFRSLGAN